MSDSISDVSVFLRLVGRRVATTRVASGLSQQELAGRSGLSADELAALEQGEYGIEVDELHQVADVLGVALVELLPGENEVRETADGLRGGEPWTQQDPAGGRSAGS